jgi:hypothetical protein
MTPYKMNNNNSFNKLHSLSKIMRTILGLGVISAIISLAFGQLDNNDPTHIIKFKNSVNHTAGTIISH